MYYVGEDGSTDIGAIVVTLSALILAHQHYNFGQDGGTWTRNIDAPNVALYQLSYILKIWWFH